MQVNVSQYENHRYTNVGQIAGRSAEHACTRCFKSGSDKPELVFAFCMISKGQHGACGDCLFRHKAMACSLSKCLSFGLYSQLTECSIDPMRLEESGTAGAVPSVSAALSAGPTGERRGTRGSVRNRGDDTLTTDLLPPPRPRNTKRRRLSSPPPSSTDAGRGRPSRGSPADEPISSRAEATEFESLFVSQSEHGDEDEDAPSEQQLDGFPSDDEAIQDAVLPSIEEHETVTNADPRDSDGDRAPSSPRQVTAGEGSPSLPPTFFWGTTPKPKRSKLTYKTPHRTILPD